MADSRAVPVGRGRTTAAHRILIAATAFGSVSAVAGGLLGVVLGGAGVPLRYLEGTPFASYVVPGLILGIVVGGTQGLAAWMLLRRRRRRALAAAVAGLGMIVWIFVELAMLGEYSWLQTAYFALGIAEVASVLVLLGVLRPLEPRDVRPSHATPPR